MKRLVVTVICCLVLLTAWLAAPAQAINFAGERLVYEFGWQNISAATATFNIDAITVEGKPGYRVVLKIQGKPKLDWIWRVRDVITTDTTADGLRCGRFFFQQREASFYLDTEIKHDAAQGLLLGSRVRLKGDTRKNLGSGSAPDTHFDPISAMLYARQFELALNKSFSIRAFDGKRSHDISYTVVGEERITTPLGEFDTWKVLPRIVRSSEVDKSSKVEKVRQVFVWIDKAERHHVLRIQTEAFVGRIFGELVQK